MRVRGRAEISAISRPANLTDERFRPQPLSMADRTFCADLGNCKTRLRVSALSVCASV
jgi:hypothetical protein